MSGVSPGARRLKSAGAILLGKLNLHEFAYGGTSNVTYFGTMHNPWALDHVTGGSSGGPGVAVASDLCFAALGTDTAGSVRMRLLSEPRLTVHGAVRELTMGWGRRQLRVRSRAQGSAGWSSFSLESA